MNIIVYQYNSEGYYVGETIAYNGLMPANTTQIVPEFEEGYIPKYSNDTWVQVENHKGEQGYVNNVPFEIKEYGAYPEGWATEYVKSAEEIRQEEINAIKQELNDIDFKSIRPTRAIQAGTQTQEDVDLLNEMEERALALRTQLNNL